MNRNWILDNKSVRNAFNVFATIIIIKIKIQLAHQGIALKKYIRTSVTYFK
jgi:hypothetical protein